MARPVRRRWQSWLAPEEPSGPSRILRVMVGSVLPILLGLLAVVVLVGVAVLVASLVMVRRVRRRWRRLRGDANLRSLLTLAGSWHTGPGGNRGGPRRWRAELWQAVAAATGAVRHAADVSGAVAELPSLVRRLRHSADELDRLLAAATGLDPATPELVMLHHQVDDTRRAADAIQRAALAAATDALSVRVDALSQDAGREVESVTAGLARSRAAFGGSGDPR